MDQSLWRDEWRGEGGTQILCTMEGKDFCWKLVYYQSAKVYEQQSN